MRCLANYFVNKIIDWKFRAQTYAPAASDYIGLLVANKGYAAVSTAYTSGDYVVPVVGNGRLYKCTTSGTSAGSAPTWPTTDGGTVTDGTAVWTEQTLALAAGTYPEVSGGSYARVAVSAALANWAGTQSAGSTTASTDTGGTTSNNGTITFPAPTGNWGLIVGTIIADASSAGNALVFGALTTPKTVNNADPAPTFPAAALSFALGTL